MPPRFPQWIIATFIFLLFLIQSAIVYWHLLFFIWWIDIPMHIAGGAWIALFVLMSYYALPRPEKKDYSDVFVIALSVALTLAVGLFWEVYEFWISHAVGDFGIGLADTLEDLVNDLVGALLASWIFIHFGYNKRQ